MDRYLKSDSAYNRLWAEYNRHGSLIVAVDYDDTIFDFHGDGESYEMVKQLVRDLKVIGCTIIIWSGNEDVNAIDIYLRENNIPWDFINENKMVNGNWVSGKDSRKVYANVYIDDRAGLAQVYEDLVRLISEVRNTKTFYRVCHETTQQGLWYDFKGDFTGLIHNEFEFCENSSLKMDFDDELVGWLSAVNKLDDLWQWFTQEDIKQLQKYGWFIHEYEAFDCKYYERFNHNVINQKTSKVVKKIEL